VHRPCCELPLAAVGGRWAEVVAGCGVTTRKNLAPRCGGGGGIGMRAPPQGRGPQGMQCYRWCRNFDHRSLDKEETIFFFGSDSFIEVGAWVGVGCVWINCWERSRDPFGHPLPPHR
jgi:hypothetical protein